MKFFQWLLLLPVLLMQVMPVGSWEIGKAHSDACEMDCCSWLVEAGLSEECGCLEKTTTPARKSPAAPKDESGAGKAIQPGWILATNRLQPPAAGAGETLGRNHHAGADRHSHVRLSVLYRAILI